MSELIKAEASLGVGDGGGQLFVHGSFEAINRTQEMILELEQLRRSCYVKERRAFVEGAEFHCIVHCGEDSEHEPEQMSEADREYMEAEAARRYPGMGPPQECIQVGDAQTPEELLSRHMAELPLHDDEIQYPSHRAMARERAAAEPPRAPREQEAIRNSVMRQLQGFAEARDRYRMGLSIWEPLPEMPDGEKLRELYRAYTDSIIQSCGATLAAPQGPAEESANAD